MASPNYGDRILKLEELCNRLAERLEMLEEALERSEAAGTLADERRKTIEFELAMMKAAVEDLKATMKENSNTHLTPDLAVLKDNVRKLEANQDRISTRGWAILAVAVGAFLTAIFRVFMDK